MVANSETIEIIRRDTQVWTVNFTDENGDPIDLTGGTVWFTVKKYSKLGINDDVNEVIQKEITTHTDPVNGITTIELSSVETDVDAGEYWYDIQLTSTWSVQSIKKWILQVIQDVTVSI